ncbi:hypothetical protein V6N13_106238 [Hibiscus sabdariffa]|uniref:Uncharacterized protein n=1 Tax=Hibiscus sabdariffa TaxID=183260 RepID=A0ABR2F029_9ROSI
MRYSQQVSCTGKYSTAEPSAIPLPSIMDEPLNLLKRRFTRISLAVMNLGLVGTCLTSVRRISQGLGRDRCQRKGEEVAADWGEEESDGGKGFEEDNWAAEERLIKVEMVEKKKVKRK